MTIEFLFIADVVLLLRLPLLLGDGRVRGAAWLGKGLIEVAVLALFAPHPFLLGAGATSIALNVASATWEARAQERHGARLLSGIVQLAVMSLWFSPAGGVRFRPELVELAQRLMTWTAFGADMSRFLAPTGLRVLFGVLISANEANLFVRWMLLRLQIKPGATSPNSRIDAGEFNRGRVIGLLERCLIYFFVLSGQYGAIGFTLAAKGFTRFKELEDRGFAEYVLVGTLLSSSVAIAIGAWVKAAGGP
jgi:hypothetical protein